MKNSSQKLLDELRRVAQRDAIPLETVEQDYALSFLLAAISQSSTLSGKLFFRGGTALRKCYFQNYRYSKDLDYSVRGKLALDDYNEALEAVATRTREMLLEQHPGCDFDIAVKLSKSRDEHADDQDYHKFAVKFPWHLQQKSGRAGRMIKLDTSHSEPILFTPEKRTLIHPYSTALKTEVMCVALDEILAEKYVAMCGIAAQIERLARQSSRPRDFYDFAHGLSGGRPENKIDFLAAVVIKAERRGLKVSSIAELATSAGIAALNRDWKPFLGDVVADLRDCHWTLKHLEAKMHEIFPDFHKNLKSASDRVSELKEEQRKQTL